MLLGSLRNMGILENAIFRGVFKASRAKFCHIVSLKLVGYPVNKSCVFAIKYFHKIVGRPNPCNSELVMYVLEDIKRICCHKPPKKTHVTAEKLQQLFGKLRGENMNFLLLEIFSYVF